MAASEVLSPTTEAFRAVDYTFWPVEHVRDAPLMGYAPQTQLTSGEWFDTDAPVNNVPAYFMANVIVGPGGKNDAQRRWRQKAPDALKLISSLPLREKRQQVVLWNAWLTSFNEKARQTFGTAAPSFALFNENGTGLVGGGGGDIDAALTQVLRDIQVKVGGQIPTFAVDLEEFSGSLLQGDPAKSKVDALLANVNEPLEFSPPSDSLTAQVRANAEILRSFLENTRLELEEIFGIYENNPGYEREFAGVQVLLAKLDDIVSL